MEKGKQRSTNSELSKLSKTGEYNVLHERTSDLNEYRAGRQCVEEEERLRYPDEALDMSIKPKTEAPEENSMLFKLITSPSYQQAESQSDEDTEDASDDNNNSFLIREDSEECYIASTSADNLKSYEKALSTSSSSNEDTVEEAVNLCKKNCCEQNAPDANAQSNEKLKHTFLYKIMTDPTFLDKIQKSKPLKRYACQFCKQEFNNSDQLADHMDVKKDESNQVVCCACKKTFAQKRYLRYHQRCHSERTMFTCEICTKKYTRMDNLSRHNAFHVNPDKFSCTYCEKTFARKDLLNKHLKSHNNKYRFFCETCQRYFKGPLTLENHKRNFHAVS
ncbi:zinc finger protein 468-like [Ceratina calcarata]|uniref:Zinc finger protein 468-like n=1 Tax=Ceratina calcarata TaxID=156304 RepID=A0AAJ7NG69_9HYME|nr:zinc finger protein 468-like [Ceratina calcarata]XP_017893562.1 zinc finger protein 468-like [Ceratina calcarata]